MTILLWIVGVILFFWIGLPLLMGTVEFLVVLGIGIVKGFKYINRARD